MAQKTRPRPPRRAAAPPSSLLTAASPPRRKVSSGRGGAAGWGGGGGAPLVALLAVLALLFPHELVQASQGVPVALGLALHSAYTCFTYRKDTESRRPALPRRLMAPALANFLGGLLAAVMLGGAGALRKEAAGTLLKLPTFLAVWAVVDNLPPQIFAAVQLSPKAPPAVARAAIFCSEGLYKLSGLAKAWGAAAVGCDAAWGAAGFFLLLGGLRGAASTLARGVDHLAYGDVRKAARSSALELRRYIALTACMLWARLALCALAEGGGGGTLAWLGPVHPLARALAWAQGSYPCTGPLTWALRVCSGPRGALEVCTRAGVLLYLLWLYLQKSAPPPGAWKAHMAGARSRGAAAAARRAARQGGQGKGGKLE